MSWENILKKKLTVNDAVIEIGSVLLGYENVDKESTGELLYDYQYHEIKDIYDDLSLDSATGIVSKPNTYQYTIQCNVYDEDKNLIAIAKVANPVKKTTEQDYTFKLKLDL